MNKPKLNTKDSKSMVRQRFEELDGLRGLLALIVFLEHLVKLYTPNAHALSPYYSTSSGLLNFTVAPFNVLINGGFAVSAFFVLTGFVVTHRFINASGVGDVSMFLIKRYVTFGSMVLFSLLLGLVLVLMFGDGYHTLATEGMFQRQVIGSFGTMPNILYQSYIGTVLNFNNEHNTVLWTLSYEFYGALIVVTFLLPIMFFYPTKKLTFIAFIAICLCASTWGTVWFSFAIGMVVYIFVANKKHLGALSVSALAVVLVVFLSNDVRGGINHPFALVNITPQSYFDRYVWYSFAGATIIIFAVRTRIKYLLSSPLLVQLGKISFSLYITHWLVLGTFGAHLINEYDYLYNFISMSITSGISLLLAIAFYLIVEKGICQNLNNLLWVISAKKMNISNGIITKILKRSEG